MAQAVLFCPGCNVKYRAKKHDPAHAYTCPKCGEALHAATRAAGGHTDGAIDSQGDVEQKEEDSLVGQTIDRLRILKKLGQGGMGAVYKAEHLGVGRLSAVKILPQGLVARAPAAVDRFMQEAQAVAALDHPNIVAVYSAGEADGHHFIEMEYVEGEDVQARLRRDKRLSIEIATKIIIQTAKALAVAHKTNIVHRDIKPANIMVTTDGGVKVMDFGLAKDVEATNGLTVTGTILGTPYYMSPEQCETKPLDGRADIYSLGVTYFCLLTGHVPFKGESALALMYMHKSEPPPDPRTLAPELPVGVHRIIQKAMAKDPGARYQTCDDMVEDLETLLRGGDPELASRRMPKAEEVLPFLRTRWGRAVVTVGGLVALAVAGWFAASASVGVFRWLAARFAAGR